MPKTRPAYPEEFRRDAVELLITSGRSLKAVADELGVTSNTLRSWRNQASKALRRCAAARRKLQPQRGQPSPVR